MPGALVAFTIRLTFLVLRLAIFTTRCAPIPVPVANTVPVSLSTKLQVVTLLPASRRITVLNVTALPHLTDTRWLLVPLARETVAVLPSRTSLVLSKPEPSAPALGPVMARLAPRFCACTAQVSSVLAAAKNAYWPIRRVIVVDFMVVTLESSIHLVIGIKLPRATGNR